MRTFKHINCDLVCIYDTTESYATPIFDRFASIHNDTTDRRGRGSTSRIDDTWMDKRDGIELLYRLYIYIICYYIYMKQVHMIESMIGDDFRVLMPLRLNDVYERRFVVSR